MRDPLINPIASLMLEDLRRAALFLDEIGAADDEVTRVRPYEARAHATRLWAASQGVERLIMAVEQLLVLERARRPSGVGES